MRDKGTGKSRGFGFVTFACSFMAEAALEAPNLTVAGKKIEARLAIPDLQRYDCIGTDSTIKWNLREFHDITYLQHFI